MLVEFEADAVQNYDYRHRGQLNPFANRAYSFQDAHHIVEDLAHDYGKWQNTECRQMKEDLMNLDPTASGRVPLSKFYSHPETDEYTFTESREYLAQIGALDDVNAADPKERIANYVAGPSN